MAKRKQANEPRDSPARENFDTIHAEKGAAASDQANPVKNEAPPIINLPKSRFRQVAAETNDDGTLSVISAWDVPNCGCAVRTVHFLKGQIIGVTEYFIPNAGIRDGKIVRSLH